MASVIPAFTARPKRTYHSQFDVWLDGRRWRLTIGDDVKDAADLENLRRSLYRRGKALGRKVRIFVFPDAIEVIATTGER